MLTNLKRMVKQSRTAYKKLGNLFAVYRNSVMTLSRLVGGIDNNMVVFSSFKYRNYNDNPRYISEALHDADPKIRIVWLFKDGQEARKHLSIPEYVTVYNSIENKGVAAMARARVVVDNFNKQFYLKFPGKGQCYIQTWHGDRAFKKVGKDDKNNYNSGIEKKASLCIAGSDYGERQFRSAFEYTGEVMKVGTPRNDILVRNDPQFRETIRRSLNIGSEKCILLYAPTFRDMAQRKKEMQHSEIDLSRVLNVLSETTGKKWVCLVRAHYQSQGIDNAVGDARLIDVTDYQEMGELMLASDALITDYSSCAGDFALLNKPIYLYQDDLSDYINNNRELYFKMEESPYWVAHDRDELDRLIRETTPGAAEANCRSILDFYGTHECGEAAKAVAEYIIHELQG